MSSARPAAAVPPTATGFECSSDEESIAIVYASPEAPRLQLAHEYPLGAQDPCEHGRLADSCSICIFGDDEVVPMTPPKKRRLEYPGAAQPPRARRAGLARAGQASPTVILASPAEEQPSLYEIALEERVKKLKAQARVMRGKLHMRGRAVSLWKACARKAEDAAYEATGKIEALEAELAKVNGQYEKLADATAELIRSLTTKLRSDGECHRTLQSTIETIYEQHL